MDRSLKWRTLALLGLILLCIGILTPSAIRFSGGDPKETLPDWFPFEKEGTLGLDIQGGQHSVYSMDLEKAVADRASEVKRDLETRFTEDKIQATVRTPQTVLGAVTVVLVDADKRAQVEQKIKSDYGEDIEMLACPNDGSISICFKVASKYADELKKAALEQAVNTIRERIDELGVAEPSVQKKDDQIIVEIPGLGDEKKQQARDAIARAAKLEFKVVDNGSAYMSNLFVHVGSDPETGKPTEPRAIKDEVIASIETWRSDEGGELQRDYYLRAPDRREALTLDEAKRIDCVNSRNQYMKTGEKAVLDNGKVWCDVSGRQVIERYLADLVKQDPKKWTVPEDRQIGYELDEPERDAKDKRPFWRTYYLESSVRLTGTSISNARPSYDPNTNRPVVLLDFNRHGSRVFGDLTAAIVGKKLATILDDKVKSAPIINSAIRGGHASITMGGVDAVRQEAERDALVNVLKTGSLTASLREESVTEVGPTLGRDAIDKTKVSFIIGAIIVMVIMVGIYKWSGWISVFSVMFHNLLTLAVMVTFGATLTLPGIAAIVLSVGMCVDGNVLIYERIRDELLLGKSVRGAVDLGFTRAFSAILDGQLTTAAAGWVLLQYGSGPIKGFAVMLLVGVFTTISTNIWVTRIFFDWYIAKKKGQMATISI